MSRIGRAPISLASNVTVSIADGNVVTVKGPLGTLTQTFSPRMTLTVENNTLTVTRPTDEKEDRALHGLTRALLHNMVVGVTEGFKTQLEIVGVGYKAEKKGTKLVLSLGYSHLVNFDEGNGITYDVPDPNTVVVKGIDKQVVGQVAAEIRSKRPPEPYLGKGIKYTGEHIRRKAGKTGK